MITEGITYLSDGGYSIDLNSSIYPLSLYESHITERLQKREKAGADGMWPTFPYEEGMEIEMEGAILADDSDDYFTKRFALVQCVRSKPAVRTRRSGILYVTFDNADEQYKVDVVVDTFNAPRNGASPNYSIFRFVVYSFTSYYVGVDTDTHYYDE